MFPVSPLSNDDACDGDVNEICKIDSNWLIDDVESIILSNDEDCDLGMTADISPNLRSTTFNGQLFFPDNINNNNSLHTDNLISTNSCSLLSSLSSNSSSSNDHEEDLMPTNELICRNLKSNQAYYLDNVLAGEMVFERSGLSCIDDAMHDELKSFRRSTRESFDENSSGDQICDTNDEDFYPMTRPRQSVTPLAQITNGVNCNTTMSIPSIDEVNNYNQNKRRRVRKSGVTCGRELVSVQGDSKKANNNKDQGITAEDVYLFSLQLKKSLVIDEYVNGPQLLTSFSCIKCPEVVTSKQLVRHLFSHINTEQLIQNNICPRCFRGFSTRGDFLRHRRLHAYKTPNTCLICMETLNSEKEFANHMNKFHKRQEMPYICKICWFHTSVLGDFYTHIDRHTDLFCPLCLDLLVYGDRIADLMAETVPSERLIKSDCYQKEINIHIQMHFSVLDTYKCGRCLLSFIDQNRLDYHVKNHHPPPDDNNYKFIGFSNKKFTLGPATLPSKLTEKCRIYLNMQALEKIYGSLIQKPESVPNGAPFPLFNFNRNAIRSPSLYSTASEESINDSDESGDSASSSKPLRMTNEIKLLVNRDSIDSVTEISEFIQLKNICVTEELYQTLNSYAFSSTVDDTPKISEIIDDNDNESVEAESTSNSRLTVNSSNSACSSSTTNNNNQNLLAMYSIKCTECDQLITGPNHLLKNRAYCHYETCKYSTFCKAAINNHVEHSKRISRNMKTILIHPKYLKYTNCLSNSVTTMFNCRHCGAIFDDAPSLFKHRRSTGHKRGGFSTDY